ncbi:MAG: DUF2993 domain-containing protein [Synechococcus sp. SB0666_bin_14]|nr:DUF2993 domain-containing protein [Synechococcus sp. SB0666_bin_14]MYG45777.1 DUF2993 domain-containing protein [Synechococcus sp. SB0675_bin_6]MYJ60301.1 DUF2993 domain-containing protein [Synechococcus sp. SB0672_bin_6]MYK91514.1 DUF2993 domain-containing protein [Synechococcus sp. SB0669_bin_8]
MRKLCAFALSPGQFPGRRPSRCSPGASASQAVAHPVLDLVRHGLQLWLRGQCDALDHLQLDLDGTPKGLLKGRLDTARLQARGVVRGELRLSRAIITCRGLQLDLGRLRPGQPLPLAAPLSVTVDLWCSAADLQHMVLDAEDAAMGVALLTHFRGPSAGNCRGWQLQITDAGLRLLPPAQQTQIPPLLLQLKAVDHEIVVHGEGVPDRPTTIPLDPAIRIHELRFDAQYLCLRGEALVKP